MATCANPGIANAAIPSVPVSTIVRRSIVSVMRLSCARPVTLR
ncbi:MAG: hypothetical protein V4659_05290 [Pseudomonadota bacterium]